MKKITLLFILPILLSSCGASWQLTTINHDPMYIDDVRVDVIESRSDLNWKLRTDDSFRWDFARYAMNQPMRWYYDNSWELGLYRTNLSAFDFYWNRTEIWWNWSFGYPYDWGWSRWNRWPYYGYSYWNDPFRFGNNWGWGNQINNYTWNNRYRTNTVYVNGRRGSTMSNQDRIGRSSMIESTKRRTNTRTNRTVVVDKDIVIDKTIIKLRRGNNNIRVYENPNNVPNNIRTNPRNYNRPKNNSRTIRNYNRPENNNNTRSNNNTRPTRRRQ